MKLALKLGLSIFDVEALDYFQGVTNKIITERSTESSEQKDFVQLCLDHMVDNPKPSEPGTEVDRHGILWTTKGGSSLLYTLKQL